MSSYLKYSILDLALVRSNFSPKKKPKLFRPGRYSGETEFAFFILASRRTDFNLGMLVFSETVMTIRLSSAPAASHIAGGFEPFARPGFGAGKLDFWRQISPSSY